MAGLAITAIPLLLYSPCLATWPAAAGERHVTVASGDKVPLEESDRRMITLKVLERHPLLAASAGIKYAEAISDGPSTDTAMVVFYPHSETGGIKTAYQAHCDRDIPTGSWSCPIVEIRRYVKLDSQDSRFE